MAELDSDEPLLPKSRAFPINGDVVRTRRHLSGYGTQRDFARKVGISADRLMQIEAGGERVFVTTLMALAQALKVPWRTLLAEPLPVDPPPRLPCPKGGKKSNSSSRQ